MFSLLIFGGVCVVRCDTENLCRDRLQLARRSFRAAGAPLRDPVSCVLYRFPVAMRQHFRDDAGAVYPSHTKQRGTLMRYAVEKTVRELLMHSAYDPVRG